MVLNGEDYFPPLQPAGAMDAHMFVASPAGGSESMHLMYLLAIAAAGAGLADSFWTVLAMLLLLNAAQGVGGPVQRAYLHTIAPSAERATVASAVSPSASVTAVDVAPELENRSPTPSPGAACS